MQWLIGVTRIYLKHAAIILTGGLFFQLAALHSVAQEKPKRPRITGIDHVRLYATDIGKANDFYSKIVGLPTKTAYGCRTASHPCFPVWNDQQIELEQAPSPAPKNWLAQIAYRTDDIVGMRRYLLTHGIGVAPITEDHNGARHFELRDPEGNFLAFIQRSELDPDFVPTNNR